MRAIQVGVHEEESLGELALALGVATDAHSAYDALRVFVQRRTPMNGLFIALYDAERDWRTCAYAYSDGDEVDAATLPPMPMNESPTSRAIRDQRAFVTRDFARAVSGLPRVDVQLDVDPRVPQCAVAVPMMARGRVLGALEIQSCERDAFCARDVDVLQLAANLAALTVENLSLRDARQAQLDRARAELRRQSVARGLVRHMMRGVSQRGRVPPTVLRELGRELAESAPYASIADFVASYDALGLGEVTVESEGEQRYAFVGRDLLEHTPGAARCTCWMALGFLEGAVGALAGGRALGTELACQSQGAPACRFVVVGRR